MAFKKGRQASCFYCDIPLTRETATVDHMQPLSRGGSRGRANCALACRLCNVRKADMTVTEFMEACNAA